MTEDSFSRILYSVSLSLPQQMNFSQANCTAGCRKMQSGGGRAGTECVQYFSFYCLFEKESLESVGSHHVRAMLGANSSILLPAQNASFPSPFSMFCSAEVKHLPYNQHVTQLQRNLAFPRRTRVRSLHFGDAVSPPDQLLGPGKPLSSLPQKDGKEKNLMFS